MRVLIVDDFARARKSLKALVATLPIVGAIREAAEGGEALAIVSAWMPDVVLMDVEMPGMDGLTATRLIKAEWPSVGVIVVSGHAEHQTAASLAGADAFVAKTEAPERLLEALDGVMGPAEECTQ